MFETFLAIRQVSWHSSNVVLLITFGFSFSFHVLTKRNLHIKRHFFDIFKGCPVQETRTSIQTLNCMVYCTIGSYAITEIAIIIALATNNFWIGSKSLRTVVFVSRNFVNIALLLLLKFLDSLVHLGNTFLVEKLGLPQLFFEPKEVFL